jgi:hypothetical protein
MLQVFSGLTLFGAFLASLGVTWFFGTVAVDTTQGIHHEVNILGIAAAFGILFVGALITLFLLVVCAAAKALVGLREQRRNESEEIARANLAETRPRVLGPGEQPHKIRRVLPDLACSRYQTDVSAS